MHDLDRRYNAMVSAMLTLTLPLPLGSNNDVTSDSDNESCE